jgi:predicted amidophosphoribosyltransferase
VIDDELRPVLAWLARRLQMSRGDVCPRCLRGRLNSNNRYGWCQPCEREYDQRILESKRRSYHRREGHEGQTRAAE